MLKKQILQHVSSESMNLSFDGPVMSGDVDVMWESICQVAVSQLVLVCYEPQFIAQIYGACGSKCIERHRERPLRWFNQPSNCTTSTEVGFLFRYLVKRILSENANSALTLCREDNSDVVLHKGADVE